MRIARLLLAAAITLAPSYALAAALFGGSPFAHVFSFLPEPPAGPPPAPASQAAAAGAVSGSLKVPTDKCLNNLVEIVNGRIESIQSSTSGAQYKQCSQMKAQCNGGACECGTTSFTGVTGALSQTKINNCDPQYDQKMEDVGITVTGTFNLQQAAANSLGNATGITQATLAPIDPNTPVGQTDMSQMLQALGTPASDAQTLAAAKPQETLDLLNNVAVGNPVDNSTIQEFHLNPDLMGNSGTFEPGGDFTVGSGAISQTSPLQQGPNDQTGPPTVSGVAQNFSPLCDQLGGCGVAACSSASPPLVCKTNNPGALTWSSWESSFGGQPCGQANNTACFPDMEHGIAAQASLLSGPRYYGQPGGANILQVICGGYAEANCSPYASFVAQNTGIGVTQPIDASNPQTLGSIMMAQSRWESGAGVVYTPEQLQSGLEIAAAHPINATTGYGLNGTPNWVTANLDYNSDAGEGSFSPPPAPVRTPTPVYYTTSYNPYGSSQSLLMYAMLGQGLMSPFSNMLGTLGQQRAQTSVASQPPPPPPPPQLQIAAQPSSIHKGDSVTVSWNSSGTLVSPPCQVLKNGTSVAQGQSGRQIVATGQVTTKTIVFTLQCYAVANNQIVTQTANVSVH